MDLHKILELVVEKLNVWLTQTVKMLPNVLLAAIILVIGLYVARLIRRIADRTFRKLSPTSTIAALGVNVVYVFSMGVVIFLILKVLRLDGTITSLLAGAGIITLALAFAFQDIAANFISGIFMSFRKPFIVGDIIKIKDFTGNVVEIKLRDTTVLTFEGQFVTIPNKDVFQSPIVNYSRYGKRRIDIKGGILKSDDLQKATRIALEALATVEGVIADESTFFYDGFGESTINFTIRVWMLTVPNASFLKVQNDAIVSVKEAFERNGISLPFPMRTLDFGEKAGKMISELKVDRENV